MGFAGFGRGSGQNINERPEVRTRSGGGEANGRRTLRGVSASRNDTVLREDDGCWMGATGPRTDPLFDPARTHRSNAWRLLVETLEELRVRQEINTLNAARNFLIDSPQELPIRDEVIALNAD